MINRVASSSSHWVGPRDEHLLLSFIFDERIATIHTMTSIVSSYLKTSTEMTLLQQRKKWYLPNWYSAVDSKEERKLILKLDLLIVPYAFLAYWTKYLDQGNLNNAYVSGLKEDLNLQGNDLVQLQTFYTVGAVVGQLPFLYLFTKLPMHWIIPLMDIAWGIFTLLQYRVTRYAELAAYRFLVGWFECLQIDR
ncbi:hypothetical protein N7495_000257 [Penicillium taxi]|uniref:uncharacterized protein n=1 Tax=Penicillium taxi TaxID=168475 RepID=UPI002545A5F8|nr:uncharacterized protein N7495_000257 [Penicillium taxi]KAJ5907575.1 hypothetical protein N7495_000257 [Penicillium taxi]